MSWSDAQSYCRKNFKDLATITTDEENQRIINNAGVNFQGWIGLKRSASGSGMWQWSDGEPSYFFQWKQVTSYNFPDADCVKFEASGWSSNYCSLNYPFICYRNLILVKKTKTWEDALQYCRMNYTDLAYASSPKQPYLVEKETAQTQTVSVWMGLRFLDGKWFWVSMELLEIPDSLPSCPIQNYRCGARNTKTHVWENRDCNEELNFLCY
ncbi:snaclec agglucetin subunit beta-1-like [Pangasianodon hypophthalmus]|uniref:snaclec agglucetin subunit beta-1-like n=1 Tax=Pangasianodon hypophthalmus TaxID=310915 RepID=UPI002307820A|nr:snaclec agglucetin subunit beta-1-like [Pangasianodon hypophthalmus]